MKYIFTSILFLQSLFALAQNYSGPESAEFDVANNRWLVANTSSHQILARDSVGTLTILASGLGSGPYGIEIVGDTIYACCGSSIKGFLLSTGAQVFNVNIGASFLNGLTHDDSGNLFTTDFSSKTIHRLNISTHADSIVASGLAQTPNGIVFDEANNRCVYVTWGSNAPIKAINLSTYAVTTVITTNLSNCDGITRDGQGRYYVSNWGNQTVVRYDSAFLTPPTTVATGLSSPADISYDPTHDVLAIPNSGNNTVTFVDFSTVGVKEVENNFDVSVYPNPVSEKLIFHSEKNEIENLLIYNCKGQEVPLEVISKEKGEWQIDITVLTTGNYFYRVVDRRGKEMKGKFLKRK
jgi:hypothetical protein